MYIHKIKLTNIRGFKSLDFDLKRPDGTYAGWTVFTGDNGSGKSTFLKALVMALVGPDTTRSLQPNLHHWVNARSGDHSAFIHLQVVSGSDDTSLDGGGHPPVKPFDVDLKLVKDGKQTELHNTTKKAKNKKSLPERTIWSRNNAGWFSCGYGPFRRVFGASSEATEIMMARPTAPYATMFQEAASLSPADRWLKDLDHRASKDPNGRDSQVRNLVLKLLKDELMPNEMTINRVDADGLWLADREGVELSWSDMSDGYRAALALLIDIVRHLSAAHEDEGLQSLVSPDSECPLCVYATGVVLIDEIDAHLHPEWQREIGFWLKRHFPLIQFLVTTHSPIICQAADPNGLFVLPEPGSDREPHALSEEDYRKIIASRPDTILLTPAFGLDNTRSQQAVEARAEYSRLVAVRHAVGKLNAAEQEKLEQLERFALTDEAP